jgi:uncharacterized delta-60 repeat protein/uncharacterized repeat protein (TIGR01451 family)
MKSFAPKSSRRRASRRHLSRGLTFAFVLVAALVAQQVARIAFAVNLSTVNTAVTQNFDTMTPASATATLPTDFRADQNQGRRTVGSYATAGTATTQTAGGGANPSTGGTYNFGSGTNNTGTDRAVGFLGSGSINGGNLYAKYTNTTGAPLAALRISYDVEKYRNGTNAAGFRFQLFYSTTGASGSWTSAGADFLTAFAGADANNNGFTTAPGATVSISNKPLGIPTIANNADIYLAWNYGVTTGTTDTNAQGLAIDNISVTPLGGSIATSGYRTTDIQSTDDAGFALALQPDGKIVVGGYAVNGSGNKDFALVRYNYDGSLDTTFDTDGKVTTDFNGTSDRIWGITLQTDGKIVAVGETISVVFPGTNDIAIARYNTNGSLDTGFGGTGKVTTDHGGGANNSAYAVAMSGTNIIVAGTENVNGNLDFMVAEYDTNGVLVPTFGTLGVTTLGFSGFNDVARGVAIDSSSRIVVGGYSNSGSNDDFAIARFTSTGVLDTTFVAGAGKAAIDLASGGPSSADQAFAIAIVPSTAPAPNANTIVLAGSTYNQATGNKDFALVRYTSTGALDSSNFGNSGIKTTDFSNSPDVAQAVYVRSDGFIVAGGFARFSASSDDFAIARYTANGTLDPTLDGDGKLTLRISNADERIYGIAQEFDGKIVAAGFAAVAGVTPVTRDFALARFNSNGSLDATTATQLNGPDLLTTVTGPAENVIVGQQFSYTVTVLNRGPDVASNVVVTDTVPAGLTYVSSSTTKGTVGESGGVVTANIGSLGVNESATVTLTVSSATMNSYTDTATATSTEPDITPANNTDSATARVIGLIDMSFVPSTVIGGCQNSTGTVTLSGQAPAGGATVTLQSADPAAASAPPNVVVPQGQTTANFPVTTSPVVSNKQVRFQADLGPITFVRRINVNAGVCN